MMTIPVAPEYFIKILDYLALTQPDGLSKMISLLMNIEDINFNRIYQILRTLSERNSTMYVNLFFDHLKKNGDNY